MNFFNIIKKSKFTQIGNIESSSIYDYASESLKPKTYAESNKLIYSVSKFFTLFYHFLSFFIALGGVVVFALSFPNLVHKIGIILFGFVFLLLLEIIKNSSSDTIFKQVARKDTLPKITLLILCIATVFSFLTSVYSAKVSIFEVTTANKFVDNNTVQNAKIDSINTLYAIQIESLNSSIESSQNTLQTSKNKWLRITVQKDLQTSQNALNNVLERKENAINSITAAKEKQDNTTTLNGNEVAYFIAFVVALLEVLNLLAYFYIYNYLMNCVLEKALMTKETLNEQPLNEKPLNEQPLNDTQNTVKTNVNDIIPNDYIIPKQPYQNTTPPTKKQIGFQFSNVSYNEPKTTYNEPKKPTQIIVQEQIKIGKCTHCKSEFVKKNKVHRFCSTPCRMENWELVKGARLNFAKK